MYHTTEKNERRTRQNALWLTVTLYVALAAFIYLQTGDKPAPKTEVAQTTAKTYSAKTRPIAQP